MLAGPWYATREQVKAASDVQKTARLDAAIDRNLARSARDLERMLVKPHLYPVVGTRYFDWPSAQQGGAELWLDANPLCSLTAMTSGGEALTIATDVFLEPANYGPPYTCVRINSASQASLNSGNAGAARALALTGVWGETILTEAAGTLSAALADTTTGVIDVTNAALIGVGDLVQVDTERMVVTGRQSVDTTVNSAGALAAAMNAQALAVPDGTAFSVGEVITIDVERMLIADILGNTLSLVRAWDGSALAAHNTNSDIYAQRRLTVSRGFGGTTAATHLISAPVLRWVPPPSASTLVIAETQNAIAQENTSWARVIGTSEAQREAFARGLIDLRKQVRHTLGRKARKAVI